MASDQIAEQLKLSSKRVASKIAKLTLEKKKLEEELNTYENNLTMLEAKIEVHREKRDNFHGKLKAMKSEKNDLYTERDKLIDKKRVLQKSKYDYHDGSSDIDTKLDKLSEQIGEVIEKSKAHGEKMQEMYEKGQEEHELMIETSKQFKQEKYESGNKILKFKRKVADIDQELNKLRRKMKTISMKLNKMEGNK